MRWLAVRIRPQAQNLILFNMGKFNLNNLSLNDDESPKKRYEKQESKKPKLTDKTKKNKGKGK
jgi:hypothetical protein